MFKPAQIHGDSLPVPQLVFSRLGFPEADEPRFKVALYMLANGECGIRQVADALHISTDLAEKAMLYWEGAGLLERSAPAPVHNVPTKPQTRVRMSLEQANLATGSDKILGAMVQELQYIFGGIMNQKEYAVYCTLYCQDEFPADMILMAAMHCAAEQKSGAFRVERTLLSWRKEGLSTCADVDAYLLLLSERERRYQEMAEVLGQAKPIFSAAERRMIDSWHEQFGYDMSMIEAARLAAGDKQNELRYLNGIIKKWQAKGYATVQDMQHGEQASNLLVQGSGKKPKKEDDLLQNTYFNPIKRKGE